MPQPGDDFVTTLTIAVAAQELTAVFKPPLEPSQQKAVDAAAQDAAAGQRMSDVIKVLIQKADQHGRTLVIETGRR